MSFTFCSSDATTHFELSSIIAIHFKYLITITYTHLFQHYKTSESQYSPNYFSNHPHVSERYIIFHLKKDPKLLLNSNRFKLLYVFEVNSVLPMMQHIIN